MKKTNKNLYKLLLIGFFSFFLAACGSNDDDDNNPTTATLSGTAAVGAALANKTVTSIDIFGIEVTTTTNADGGYSMTVDGGAKPYMLKVEVDNSGQVLYSFAEEGGTVNITPMTNLALHEANKVGATYSELSGLFSGFANNYSRITPAVLNEAKAKVNANLATLLSNASVDNGFDFFKTAFSPDGSGIDAVLDALDITIGSGANAGNILINLDGAGFTDFLAGIDTTNFTIGGTGGTGGNGNTGGATGTWTLVVATTVSGITTEATITDFPASAVPTGDNAAAINAAQQEFNDSFGNLGSVSNFSFTFVSSSDTQVVTRTTATITTPPVEVQGNTFPGTSISYSQTFTYTRQ